MSKYKKNKAVALKYNAEEDAAPIVIASGYGTVAEKIIDIAEKKGIPIFKDDSTASLLCMMEVGSNIPTELYEVIAAIYCKLMETSKQIKETENSHSKKNTRTNAKSAVRSNLTSSRRQKSADNNKVKKMAGNQEE